MATHHANHLRHEGWRTRQKFAGFISDTIELLACVIVSVGFGWFVGLSQSARPFGLPTYMLQCIEPSTWLQRLH